MNIKYFLYVRKSTEDDDKQVMIIDAQLEELKQYARNSVDGGQICSLYLLFLM